MSEVKAKLFPYLFKDTPFFLQLTEGVGQPDTEQDKVAFLVSLYVTDADATDVFASSSIKD